jgi:hypothetical protein
MHALLCTLTGAITAGFHRSALSASRNLAALFVPVGLLATGCGDEHVSASVPNPRAVAFADAQHRVTPLPADLRADPLVWVEQDKLLAADGTTFDHFGQSVAISGDTCRPSPMAPPAAPTWNA